MGKIKKYWEEIKSIGVSADTSLKDAKYIRMTNALAVIVGVWLISTIPTVFLVDPASAKYIILKKTLLQKVNFKDFFEI